MLSSSTKSHLSEILGRGERDYHFASTAATISPQLQERTSHSNQRQMAQEKKNQYEDLCTEMVDDFHVAGRTGVLPVGSTAWIRCCYITLLDGNYLVILARACSGHRSSSDDKGLTVDSRSTALAVKLLKLAEEEMGTVGAQHEGVEFKFDVVGSSAQ